MSRKSVQTLLYDNFRAGSYSDVSQIKIREKILFIAIFRFTISFLGLHFLKTPTLIRNAKFHSFDSFYLDCLFKFGLREIVEKCVDFVNYRITWQESMTTKMLLEGWQHPKIAHGEIWWVWRMRWPFNISVFEVFLYQLRSIGTCTRIIWMQNPLVLQF